MNKQKIALPSSSVVAPLPRSGATVVSTQADQMHEGFCQTRIERVRKSRHSLPKNHETTDQLRVTG